MLVRARQSMQSAPQGGVSEQWAFISLDLQPYFPCGHFTCLQKYTNSVANLNDGVTVAFSVFIFIIDRTTRA